LEEFVIDRKQQMQEWLKGLGYDIQTLKTASEDASFRRYFRIEKEGGSYIVMDAPPENEPCGLFVTLATSLCQHHINAPVIYEKNIEQGYLVLSDFGDDLLLGLLNEDTADDLYRDAINTIIQMQNNMPSDDIPEYSAQLLNKEMDLFKDWFLEELLGINFNQQQSTVWEEAKEALIKNAIEQPQTFVHRDFHSRNLIKTPSGAIGIIDFQDAVKGALTYDLVSLLRDCYIAWPEAKVDSWVLYFYEQAKTKGLLNVSLKQFKTWFNLMGVQRHLKAIGIFSRLKLRDGKNDYVADIPRTFSYIEQVSKVEPSLAGLGELIAVLGLTEKVNVMAVH